MRNLAVGFAVGAVVGGAATAYVLIKKPDTVRVSTGHKPTPSSIQYHPALKYGAPTSGVSNQNMRFYDGFVAAFDTRTRNPSWVLEHLQWKDKNDDGVDRSKSDFFEDKQIDEKFRNRIADFKGSGYDRGHLAPAANHKSSQKAMNETFTMSNVSPQVGRGFNRDYWARFEKFVKDLMKFSTAVYVVTGPLWLPKMDKKSKKWTMQYPLIGEPPRLVSVPTHFYKVILAERAGGGPTGVGAFVMPNEEIDPNTPLVRFSAPIGDLECATGMKFFPNYLTDDRKAVLDDTAVEWREYGKAKQIQSGKNSNPQLPAESSASESVELEKKTSTQETAVVSRGLPKTRLGGKGAVHLCENTGCEVAQREFWTKKK
ncbi:hypothetical protein BSKO_10252 [Bryopsis sp. KO-2023]|nr:hypothetical protein BSKO_10252 [Bryopsis sp. KO-2023]